MLYQLSSDSWGVGALFVGLWLIPMGHLASSSRRMPMWLGRILIVGGAGYLLSAFVSYGFGNAPTWLIDLLAVPATVGELWMIGYLLTVGIREPSSGEATPTG